MEWVAGAFENITGYTFEEYLAHGSWLASLHPDDLAEDARNMAMLSQNQPVAADLRTITKDGQVRWVRSYARPIWDEQKNRLAGIYGAVKDITAQKQAEIREENRRMMLEKVVILGKKISGVTSLRDCLLQIYWSIRNDLGFDRVGIFLYETAARQIRGTFGTGINGELEDTSDYVAQVLEGDSWDTALKNPNGFYLIDNLEQKYGEIPIPAEMRGVREHCTVSAWAGETPVAFIATDNLLSQRKMPAEQMEALHLFAGYVGLAIQNARWSEDLKRRVADLDAINQVSHTLVTQPELLPLIQAVGERIRTMFGLSVVYIALLETETNLINFYYQYENERFIQGTQIPYGRGMTSRTMELRHPILINSNWEQESAKYDVIRDNVPPSKASLTVPLLVGEQAIGAISLQDTEKENVFTDDHLRQLTIIASNLAVAIDHARLYATLQKELAERKQAEEAIRSLNAKLEQHVIERTAALAAANRELESLSYTIGHDLRSPIRAIAAYSHLLLDELGEQLEASQVDKLREVNQVAQRMGRMVDDFLAFLRLGRIVVQQRSVDVKPLVESVIAGFKDEVTGRQVDFIVQAMPPCQADFDLLRVVYTQLISNALKFTQPRNPARIEIGAGEHQGKTCYYVRDNGVGFDMRYAGKLFGVFQRLHHLSEFEGTGVGLAIIHRIIHHHGGRIWAEAEVDKGATFYFTLG
jgi:PAS domain S-box-containing protein